MTIATALLTGAAVWFVVAAFAWSLCKAASR